MEGPNHRGVTRPARRVLAQRLKIELTAGSLAVTATLYCPSEVDTLIKMLEANKAMLSEEPSI